MTRDKAVIGPARAPMALTDVQSEAALLGALIADNSRVDVVADLLLPADFSESLHADIYETVLRLTAAGAQADPSTLRPAFANDPRMLELGGAQYLHTLTDGVLFFLEIKETARVLADLAARRRLIKALNVTIDNVPDAERALNQLVEEADSALVAAVERRESLTQISAGDAARAALQEIETIRRDGSPVGARCGISDIDDMLGGFRPGQMIIVGARPGMGKTAVAVAIARGCAQRGSGTLFVSLEMSAIEISQRMMADMAFKAGRGIEFDHIVNATLGSSSMSELVRISRELDEMPLTIVDAGSMTTARLALGIRRHKRRFAAAGVPLNLVVVDYLQLLRADREYRSVYETISDISRSIKAMAKDCGVAVLALAQLNRALEGRDDKRPTLADLRDSGQIEQDADAVMFLHREEYYLARQRPKKGADVDEQEAMKHAAAGRIDFILAKRRNGQSGISRRGHYVTHYQAVRGSDLYAEERGENLL